MNLTNDVYDKLKWVAQYGIPTAATLYYLVGTAFGLPYAQQVVGVATSLDACLGILLGISTANYKGDGTIEISTTDENKDIYTLALNMPVEDIAKQTTVLLKVAKDVSSVTESTANTK